MAPIAFVTMTEHFGHVMVLNSLTGRDFFKDPGLDRTLTGDGFGTGAQLEFLQCSTGNII